MTLYSPTEHQDQHVSVWRQEMQLDFLVPSCYIKRVILNI